MKNKGKNLKERKEGYKEMFGRKKEKREMM